MNAISEQIQEPELVAEMKEPEIVAGAITDGSQAMAHDLFWSFHKRAPRIAPVAPLSPAHEINQQILEQIFSTTEWREMRESGTIGDPLSSAMATIGCTASAIAALDKETVRYVNQIHELTSEVERLFSRAETLKELAALSQDAQRSERLKAEAGQALADAEKKEKKAERLGRRLEESSDAREQQVRRAVRQGLAEALGEIEQTNDAIKAFGGGYAAGFGTESGTGGRNSLSTKEKLAIAGRVGRSPKLQQIAAVCGRFTRIALLLKQLSEGIRKEDIKQREGWRDRNGQTHYVDYVEWHCVADLLDKLVPTWSHSVRGITQIGEFAVATAAITINGVTREGVGTGPADSETGIKKAEHDALKRAAVKFGVARELYREEEKGGGSSEQSNGTGLRTPRVSDPIANLFDTSVYITSLRRGNDQVMQTRNLEWSGTVHSTPKPEGSWWAKIRAPGDAWSLVRKHMPA